MYKLYNGDCLEVMKNIPDRSIDMILCDLPYGTTACKWDIVIPFDLLWEQYKRIIKSNGIICLFGSQPFTSELVCSNIKWFSHCWIWKKEQGTNILCCNMLPLKIHEDILIFRKPNNRKGKLTYNPQMIAGKPYIKKRNNRVVYDPIIDKYTKQTDTFNKGERYPTTVIEFNREKNRLHPTQKPVKLLEYLVKTYTNEGETVLDNCMGSGSTGIACMNTNRNFIGIEKDEKYFEIAKNRIIESKTA